MRRDGVGLIVTGIDPSWAVYGTATASATVRLARSLRRAERPDVHRKQKRQSSQEQD